MPSVFTIIPGKVVIGYSGIYPATSDNLQSRILQRVFSVFVETDSFFCSLNIVDPLIFSSLPLFLNV